MRLATSDPSSDTCRGLLSFSDDSSKPWNPLPVTSSTPDEAFSIGGLREPTLDTEDW